MNAKIAFKLLALSQLLTRILVLHVLRKLDGARPVAGKLPAVRILGLINVLLAPDSAAVSEVRPELEASRITFKVEIDVSKELVGYIGGIPRMRIELGQGSTLHLMILAADAVLVFRAG
ncbi:hypothetical protein [Bradyrhizobium japonicum]|jgi:hypothetical protein|uniref:hypothetical protein n=1 Tax=Bradyrhizobium japonicum TaxID=375 RepID=UPI00209F406D|nr:hypothetical protein [Bradyrhizobium japonicum]MCP1761724.1 hypothetical protein [Bradyrhizobium japonicum]MCP1793304.1 hypothetical protein [Bradyrhizobium japonicum]MCP1805737.1 hypothetical protein [Bradyrhizobium japonicum]MCP1814754.1 hypothetical protein [Bradyrhizobium japonicum]MCP1873817.1 hypothetical protein [Bradyrhizobium japonicum]